MTTITGSRGRIAMVTPGYPPDVGGVEQHAGQLAPALVKLGFAVDVLTQGGQVEAVEGERGGLRVLRFPLTIRARHYRFSVAMWRYLRARGGSYGAVHAHNYHALPALLAATSAQRALILTPHYHGESADRIRQALHRVYKVPGRQMFDRAARVICVSRAEASLIEQHFPAARGRIAIIPNGVDRARIAAATAFDGYGRRLVLTVGRLDRYKRVDRTIEALAELPSMVLNVIGRGEGHAFLAQRAEGLGISERVRFLGRVSDNDLARWYKSAAVVVSLSEHESFGLVAAEALAAGSSVVLSDIPAHRDVAELAETSNVRVVAAQATAAQVAAAIRSVAEAPSSASRVCDWTEVARLTADVYDDALRGVGSRARRTAGDAPAGGWHTSPTNDAIIDHSPEHPSGPCQL